MPEMPLAASSGTLCIPPRDPCLERCKRTSSGQNGEKRATEEPLDGRLSDGPRAETAKVAGSSPVHPANFTFSLRVGR